VIVSAEELERLLDEFGIPTGSDPGLQLRTFLALLQRWNARINLTASTEWDALGPLFAEGLWASGFYPAQSVRHLDIGSGAGFPGIPMRIMAPQMKLEMVESRAKRAYFLENASSELGLADTEVRQQRIDEFLRSSHEAWDCFSWKALRLAKEDLELLIGRAKPESRFWMFHGKELSVQDPRIIDKKLEMERQENFPEKKEWRLSIYRLKRVSSFQFPVPG
jgi:16S rRNA (guanine(527)-N(7))-methyltransferase RsmG